MAVVKRRADADPAAGVVVLPGDKPQLDLERICVGVAGVGGLEVSPGIAAARHEQLGSVVDVGELGAHQLSGRPAEGSDSVPRRQ